MGDYIMSQRNQVAEAPHPDLWSIDAPSRKPQPRAHFHGHRERLRERAGICLTALPDYELLELLLFRSIPRGDVKPLAKALLARFGSFAAVASAPKPICAACPAWARLWRSTFACSTRRPCA